LKKLLTLIAFSVLLLVPVGAQNVFAGNSVCLASSNLGALTSDSLNCIRVDDKTFTNFRNYVSQGGVIVSADMIQVDGVTVGDEHGLKFTCLQQLCDITNSPPTTNGLSIFFDYDVISDGDLISDNTLTLDSFIVEETTTVPPFGFSRVIVEERVYSDLGQTNEIAFKDVFATDETGEDLSDHINYPSLHQSVSVDVVISLLTTGNAHAQLNEFTQTFSQSRQAVGGELIPLDSTMILAAGAQYIAAWILPVIVSGIGFAIVIARKF